MVQSSEEKVKFLSRAIEVSETSLLERNLDEVYAQLLELDPSNSKGLMKQANQLFAAEKWSELVDLYTTYEKSFFMENAKPLERKQDKIRFYIRFAEALMHLEQSPQAMSKIKKAIQMQPTDIQTLQELGDSLMKLQEFAEAIPVYQQIIPLLNVQTQRAELAKVHNQLAKSMQALENWDAAIAHYQKARLIDKDNMEAFKGILECTYHKEEFNRVAQLCSNLIKQGRTEEDVVFGYLLRGFVLDKHFDKSDFAEQHYWKALEYQQNHPVALLYLSEKAILKQKWPTALGQLKQGWESAQEVAKLRILCAMGLYYVADIQEDTELKEEMEVILKESNISLDDTLLAHWRQALNKRLF